MFEHTMAEDNSEYLVELGSKKDVIAEYNNDKH